MEKYKYAVLDHDETYEDAITIECIYDKECGDDIAEEAAEYEHNNRDGWEASWPLDIQIWTMDGKDLGVYEVDRESIPNFVANKKNGA